MISQTNPSYFPTMTSPIKSCGGAITNLFTIPQKQEGREGNRWEGQRMASKGHNAYCSLPPPPHPLSLSLLYSTRSLAVRRVRESGGSQSVWQYCIQVVVNNGGQPQRILGTWAQPSSPAGGSWMPDPSIHIGLLRLSGAREREKEREIWSSYMRAACITMFVGEKDNNQTNNGNNHTQAQCQIFL